MGKPCRRDLQSRAAILGRLVREIGEDNMLEPRGLLAMAAAMAGWAWP